ncbi:DUF1289 domain-containing protein [Sphingomonas koreensis]|jgi:predicted Fe-S protein YdhL (DUF1289 family)|uniref:DUF1289 domain-containing protein n=1 Tax=Sphingomonas koreensis TaxID=93064 RepID=A0A1L6J8F6_9SPHN|nr:DUF1289 domain-containing protein [Sphingomonas koreensis]APR52251.1 hypothetical protein BRX40_07240 [Sphingomonas koreensis]MDC7811382.1 DUF1289 domain-containing protein [Sphingomonas koreensis]RSU19855.1 DUF1289 domain-containing protein [Sphingomonas koreensis]RSU26642.1 DUF1289 domain-containing protein [Sphingomonas koreensis]RSU27423.1 DUF1289 domain-containing protein [Sphingomonas koreensis]
MSAVEDEDDFLAFTPLPAVESPCVSICRMKDGLCEGCGRTLNEIAEWSMASDDRRREILSRIATARA